MWLFSQLNRGKQVEFKGLSGQIEFKEGQRNFFKLDLMKLKQNFFVKCGEWSQPIGLNITDYEALFEGNQMNTTLVVTTILQIPYVMMHTSKNITGNARFYGFCVDLLERISKQIGFNYILDLVQDRKVNLFSFACLFNFHMSFFYLSPKNLIIFIEVRCKRC
jgi:ionotropic kainate glutamate receptor 2